MVIVGLTYGLDFWIVVGEKKDWYLGVSVGSLKNPEGNQRSSHQKETTDIPVEVLWTQTTWRRPQGRSRGS